MSGNSLKLPDMPYRDIDFEYGLASVRYRVTIGRDIVNMGGLTAVVKDQ
jgi:hypothetical protein